MNRTNQSLPRERGPAPTFAVVRAALLWAALSGAIAPPGEVMAEAVIQVVTPDSTSASPQQGTSNSIPSPASDVERLSLERAAADEKIRSELQAVFDRVDALAGVEVSVDAGIVRLLGSVLEARAAAQAEDLAGARAGVVFVENRIEVSATVRERLQPAWDRLRTFAAELLVKVPLLVVALGIVMAAGVAGWLISRLPGLPLLRARNPFLDGMVRRLLQSAVVLTGIFVALDLLDATKLVGAVAGTAGLAGLAIGFAFKSVVENYLAGITLAVRQPFAGSDHIVVGDFEGKVVRLTLRETILMTPDGNHVRLPNAMVFGSPILNYTRNPLRRFSFEAGVGPADDLALAQETAVAALCEMTGVLLEPSPQALVVGLGDSSVTIKFVGWVDQRAADFSRVKSEAIRLVKSRLEEAEITLPSPEFVIQMDRSQGLGGGGVTTRPAVQADVSVDRAVDRQIEADREASGEGNLLDAGAGRSSLQE